VLMVKPICGSGETATWPASSDHLVLDPDLDREAFEENYPLSRTSGIAADGISVACRISRKSFSAHAGSEARTPRCPALMALCCRNGLILKGTQHHSTHTGVALEAIVADAMVASELISVVSSWSCITRLSS